MSAVLLRLTRAAGPLALGLALTTAAATAQTPPDTPRSAAGETTAAAGATGDRANGTARPPTGERSRAPNGLPPARRAAAPTPAEAAVAGSDAGSGASTAVDATTPTRRDRVRRFFRKGWPYMVAGALLAGVVTAVVVRRGDGGKGATPVLRFRPGPAPSP